MKIDFAKPETQAIKAITLIQKKGLIVSVGTNRNYKDCLINVAKYIKTNRCGDLRHVAIEIAELFLQKHSAVYSQKTLDMHRQALQALFVARGLLTPNEKLKIIRSSKKTLLKHRAYTSAQVFLIANAQTEKHRFATLLAYASGLRAHELFTLLPLTERPADIRYYEDGSVKSLPSKWKGRDDGVAYSVIGKGGLIREIRIPTHLAEHLESLRLPHPQTIQDRNINYQTHYSIAGGQCWSNSFSAASKRSLGWSTGAHGLRHAYAQERLSELQNLFSYEIAIETVSQEMGHFRPEITEVYLR